MRRIFEEFGRARAELEGMKYLTLFRQVLERARSGSIRFVLPHDLAKDLLDGPAAIPICDLAPGMVGGRSGMLAVQQCS